jgi:DNA-binding SARP family transcriptional activator
MTATITARWETHALLDSRPTALPQEHGLVVRCFGRFDVSRDGRLIQDWRRDKSRTLLKLLVAHHGSIKRDVPLDTLWPELELDSALGNLRVTLHALRKALDDGRTQAAPLPYVLTHGDALELNPEVPLWVDTVAFRRLYALASDLRRTGRLDDSLRAYEAAEHLYRDEYMLDDLYEEWTVIPREQFKDEYLLVVTRLADAALATAITTAASITVTRSSPGRRPARMRTSYSFGATRRWATVRAHYAGSTSAARFSSASWA